MDFFEYRQDKNDRIIYYSDFIYPGFVDEEERKSLRLYTSDAYKSINYILRNTNDLNSEYIILPTIKNIDNCINKFNYKGDIVVYRYVSFPNEFQSESFLRLLKKGEFIDKAYLSCSLNPIAYNGKREFCFKIHVTSINKGACIKSFSKYMPEEEYLLRRNTELEILDIKYNGNYEFKYFIKARVK